MDEIPHYLIESIAKKNIVLFLGSGFLYNANHPNGDKAPLGANLAKLLSKKFLNNRFNDEPLTYVSDLAISETNLFAVQSYISEIFSKFTPTHAHVLFATFPWKAIFTTNYDLIVEKAYEQTTDAVQDLSVVIRNTPQQQIFKTVNSVPYYKLHGCIRNINDANLPLILSTEQYIEHQANRERLFSKLLEMAMDYSILFVGYSNQDFNIRSILKQVETLKDGRPRSFLIRPNMSDEEARYWGDRKFTTIKMGYEEFVEQIDKKISKNDRKLSQFRNDVDKPIYKKFQLNIEDSKPTESLISFLDHESDFVHSSMPSKETTPKAFYRGYFENWDPIIKNLDVERHEKDKILTQLILEDRYQNKKKPFLFIVKGYAGSGKSVLLKRVAWEASVEFEKVCIFINHNTSLRHEPILELYNYIKRRLYIFVDNAIDNEKGIIALIERAERNKIPITVICSERTNIWNDESELTNYVAEEFQVSYLTSNEIDNLIKKLEKHKSLGYLENKSEKERKIEFQEKAGRVLLVALYEATAGKPFEEIIFDEFKQIKSDQARSLYITVSILHRLGSEARAGLISRVHGINFNEFKEKFFDPLEFIVFSEKDYLIGDYVYKTRHQHIAEIIFETVLSSEQDRHDEYVRILTYLDADFKSDLNAFMAMTNARKLKDIFSDSNHIRNLYKIAEENDPDNPKLLQQKAIFEIISNDGSLSEAEVFLKKAHDIIPKDPMISHSLAEVSLKRAETSINLIEKAKYLNEAIDLCNNILRKYKNRIHPYHTLLKIALIKLSDTISDGDAPSIESKIKEIERLLTITKQQFPEDEFLLEIESKFNHLINNEPKAVELLKQAHEINKATPFIALRYAKILEENESLEDAIKVLKETLNLNTNDKDINFKYAHLISKSDPNNEKDIIHYYRRSFTKGDTRYEAQFWYARALYMFNHIEKARKIFDDLSFAKIPPDKKNADRGILISKDNIVIFKGTLVRKESNFAFVQRDGIGDDIFVYRYKQVLNWDLFKIGNRVEFNLAFNFKGSVALNIKISN